MGDYLTDLAARSLNLVEIVLPRPVALFEPAPAGGETRPWHVAGPALGEDEPHVQGALVETSPSGPPPRPPALPRAPEHVAPRPLEAGTPPSVSTLAEMPLQPRPLQVVEPRAPLGVARRPIESAAERRQTPGPGPPQPPVAAPLPPPAPAASLLEPSLPPQAPRPGHPTDEAVPLRAESRVDRAPQERLTVLEPLVKRTVIEETMSRTPVPAPDVAPAPAGPAPARSAARGEGPSPPTPDRARREPPPDPPAPPRARRAPPPAPMPPATVAVQPRVRPAPPLQPELFTRPEPTPAPGPTVQVTIGRIEVRATPPPSPPQPQRRPSTPPVMSLDEYLRQRANGGNR